MYIKGGMLSMPTLYDEWNNDTSTVFQEVGRMMVTMMPLLTKVGFEAIKCDRISHTYLSWLFVSVTIFKGDYVSHTYLREFFLSVATRDNYEYYEFCIDLHSLDSLKLHGITKTNELWRSLSVFSLLKGKNRNYGITN